MIRVAIADDEPELARHLAAKLAELWPAAEVVGVAANGRAALELLHSERPDVAFLDIEMPTLSGLEVARAAPEATRFVFVTAFDRYAVEAFEAAAVDYILKPVTDDRLRATIARLEGSADADRRALASLLERWPSAPAEWLEWLRIGRGESTELVPVAEVVYLRADRKYTTVVTDEGEELIRTSLKELEATLDPSKFWRVHRSVIVNVARIERATRDLRGRFHLSLRGRRERLPVSQRFAHRFRQM